jgi:hypothetical protein
VALLRLYGKRGNRAGIKPAQRNRLAGFLAVAVTAIFDPLQRSFDLGNQLALAVPGAQFERPVRFGRRAVCRVGQHQVFGLQMLQRFPAFTQDFFFPGEQLCPEIFLLPLPQLHEGRCRQRRHPLERPLLVKGEPGTGKTELARAKQVATQRSDLDLIEWHIKSTTKAQQGLYEYDAVSRLRDSQLGDPRFEDIKNYIKRGKLWEAFTAGKRPVLLIDEIDKADIEFPNDLLQELDRMEFFVYETGETIKRRRTGRSSSSPPTTRRNCPTPSCAAVSSTTSSSPMPKPCATSSRCTSPV